MASSAWRWRLAAGHLVSIVCCRLRNPDAVKMGSKMPNYLLTEEEIDALVAYLYSLK